jgi:PPOX class probable F420-dependent enzyme
MSPHGHTTIGNPTHRWSPAPAMDRGRRFVLAVTLLAGLFMTAAGMAALLAPSWFADTAGFPRHTHFVHDAGAFQLGIGVTLLLALIWHDGLALALAGFLVANTAHAVNHAVDLDLGGHSSDPWGLAALSLLTVVALVVRLGQLGWVVGEVAPAASPVLVRFLRQKTVLVTTYRRDGRPVGTPVSLAVDGDHAYVRSFEKAGKTRRIHNNPRVEVAPSTARGRPTGPTIQATARPRPGPCRAPESRRAAHLLAAKHALLRVADPVASLPYTPRRVLGVLRDGGPQTAEQLRGRLRGRTPRPPTVLVALATLHAAGLAIEDPPGRGSRASRPAEMTCLGSCGCEGRTTCGTPSRPGWRTPASLPE